MKKRHLRKGIVKAIDALLDGLTMLIAAVVGVIIPFLYIVGLIG